MSDFVISRYADFPKPIARVRADRAYVPLERTRPLESWGKSWASGIGLIAFMIAGFVVLSWVV